MPFYARCVPAILKYTAVHYVAVEGVRHETRGGGGVTTERLRRESVAAATPLRSAVAVRVNRAALTTDLLSVADVATRVPAPSAVWDPVEDRSWACSRHPARLSGSPATSRRRRVVTNGESPTGTPKQLTLWSRQPQDGVGITRLRARRFSDSQIVPRWRYCARRCVAGGQVSTTCSSTLVLITR